MAAVTIAKKALSEKNVKIAILIASFVLVVFIIVQVRRFAKDKKNEGIDDDTKLGEKLPKKAKDGSTENSANTISKGEAKVIAQQQLQAMDEGGTNLEMLFGSLTGLNGKSLEKVYNEFGKIRYLFIGRSPIPNYGRPLDLFGWYKEELDDDQMFAMRNLWSRSNLRF